MKRIKKKRRRTIVASFKLPQTALYQQELVQCGKPKCKRCRRWPAHGPYWYAYAWSQKTKRLVSTYVGKTLPETLAPDTGPKTSPETDGEPTNKRRPKKPVVGAGP